MLEKALQGRLNAGTGEIATGIPWVLMAGMRDKLIHAYDAVDLFEVWNTVERDIPELLRFIELLSPGESLDNAIYVSDSADVVRHKVRRMVSDVTGSHPRLRPTGPGILEDNPAFLYHEAFNLNGEEVDDLKSRYRSGQVSDVEVKDSLVSVLNEFLEPIRGRRAYFESHPEDVKEAPLSGIRREMKLAEATMQQVQEAMRVIYT